MFFGLPWFAIVAIVGILIPLGGMFYSFKEKELKMEEKRYTSAKESQELRKMILSLKSRIENLETIITDQDEVKGEITLDDIEIKDDLDGNRKSDRIRN
tara:strand:+ start:17133 stop:17429 length:297 start_codon:yes stop_codon:yes gene_type:complete